MKNPLYLGYVYPHQSSRVHIFVYQYLHRGDPRTPPPLLRNVPPPMQLELRTPSVTADRRAGLCQSLRLSGHVMVIPSGQVARLTGGYTRQHKHTDLVPSAVTRHRTPLSAAVRSRCCRLYPSPLSIAIRSCLLRCPAIRHSLLQSTAAIRCCPLLSAAVRRRGPQSVAVHCRYPLLSAVVRCCPSPWATVCSRPLSLSAAVRRRGPLSVTDPRSVLRYPPLSASTYNLPPSVVRGAVMSLLSATVRCDVLLFAAAVRHRSVAGQADPMICRRAPLLAARPASRSISRREMRCC